MKSPFSLVLWTITTMEFVTSAKALIVVKWNKHVGEFEQISELPFYDRETNNRYLQTTKAVASQKQNHNFHGKPLKLTYFQENSFVQFTDNDTKVSGVYGDMWTILSEMLNFTLVTERSEENSVGFPSDNGSYSGILEKARLNKTDIIPMIEAVLDRTQAVSITTNFWPKHFRIFAHPQWSRDEFWIFKQFSVKTWCCLLFFVVILSVGRSAMHKILTMYRGSKFRTSLLDHVFDTLAMFCNQGRTIDCKSTGVKILMITTSTFFWLILASYSAGLINSLSHKVFASPVKDWYSMLTRTSLQIVVKNGSFAHLSFIAPKAGSGFDHINRANRLTAVSTFGEVKETICAKPQNYVLIAGDDDVGIIDEMTCDLLPIDRNSFSVPMAAGISKRVKNKESIDIGIMKLREFGIASAIRRRQFPSDLIKSRPQQTDDQAIDLNQFSLVLAVLVIGIVASVAICIAENIFVVLKERKNDRSPSQRFPTIEQPPDVRIEPVPSTDDITARLYFSELYNDPKPRPKISWRSLIREDEVNEVNEGNGGSPVSGALKSAVKCSKNPGKFMESLQLS